MLSYYPIKEYMRAVRIGTIFGAIGLWFLDTYFPVLPDLGCYCSYYLAVISVVLFSLSEVLCIFCK